MDEPTTTSEESPRRPWTVTLASLAMSVLGALGLLGNWAQLQQAQAAQPVVPPVDNALSGLLSVALFEFEQGHRKGVLALAALGVVATGVLLVGSVRVLLRAPDAGWLWRQALAVNVVASLVRAVVEQSWVRARFAAFRAVLARTTQPVTLPKGLSQDDLSRFVKLSFDLAAGMAWISLGILVAMWAWAGREKTRQFTG